VELFDRLRSRLVWLRIFVDGGELFSRLRGDGFIVSSALGSTAYSLSAGGPVVDPLLKNILVTPICPQTLAHRSVLLGENAVVRVEVLDNDTPSYLTGDGQAGSEFGAGQSLEVRRAERPVLFCVPYKLAPAYREPFQALRGKLGFGV
jgi:NAD+ kinase